MIMIKYLILLILSINTMSSQIEYKSSKFDFLTQATNTIKRFETETFQRAIKYLPLIYDLSFELDVDPSLITSIVWAESHFNHNAVSNKSAQGLMQIMPKTKEDIYKRLNVKQEVILKYLNKGYSFDVVENIYLGIIYFKYLHSNFKDINKSIVAYNMGPSWVNKNLKNRKAGKRNKYLNKVNRYYSVLSKNDFVTPRENINIPYNILALEPIFKLDNQKFTISL